MTPISKEIAQEIAFAYREVETAERILADIDKALETREPPDIRDVFGRRQFGLTLGVPAGPGGQQLFDVPWSLARPIILAHVANKKAVIAFLSEKARVELGGHQGAEVPA